MSVNISTISAKNNFPPQLSEKQGILYPETDNSIMPEGILHFLMRVRLTSTLLAFFANRSDVKIFGNVMLYFEEGQPRKFVSPDLMICFGLEESPTSVYKLWETRVVPSVVIEFASETTWFNDVSNKLAIYQRLGVQEYYVYDVEYKHLPAPLTAYCLEDGVLTETVVREGKILSESLGLELVDTGATLRFFNHQMDEFLMTPEEMVAEIARLKAEK